MLTKAQRGLKRELFSLRKIVSVIFRANETFLRIPTCEGWGGANTFGNGKALWQTGNNCNQSKDAFPLIFYDSQLIFALSLWFYSIISWVIQKTKKTVRGSNDNGFLRFHQWKSSSIIFLWQRIDSLHRIHSSESQIINNRKRYNIQPKVYWVALKCTLWLPCLQLWELPFFLRRLWWETFVCPPLLLSYKPCNRERLFSWITKQ